MPPLPPALPTDAYPERKLGIPIIKIRAALLELGRAGMIARASVFVRNKAQRRNLPSLEMLGATFPRREIPTFPRRVEMTDIFNKETDFPALRLSATQLAARKEVRGAS